MFQRATEERQKYALNKCVSELIYFNSILHYKNWNNYTENEIIEKK